MVDGQLPTLDTAERLRKNGEHARACDLFAQLWQRAPDQRIGWRYAFCLRKMGRLEDAEKVARDALARFPEDIYTRSELGWILYERQLKPARDEGNLERVLHNAKEILNLNQDRLALTVVALAVMQVAKARKNWEVLLQWADRLRPEDLGSEPTVVNGKRVMPQRESWYVNRARALLELGRHAEARQVAQAGLAEFRDEIFLRRTAALALARSGDLAAGIAEMRALLSHPRADWYVKAELAEMEHQAGNHAEAYRLLCDAISDPRQSDEFKVEYFLTMARIALAVGKLDVAAEHIALNKAIRMDRNWGLPVELLKLEKKVHEALQTSKHAWPELPKDTKQLSALCHRRWQEGAREGLQLLHGTVKPYPEGRQFTYIQREDGGDDVFVLVKDLPLTCRRGGSRVEFALKTSYDRKKERESVQATHVRPLTDKAARPS